MMGVWYGRWLNASRPAGINHVLVEPGKSVDAGLRRHDGMLTGVLTGIWLAIFTGYPVGHPDGVSSRSSRRGIQSVILMGI